MFQSVTIDHYCYKQQTFFVASSSGENRDSMFYEPSCCYYWCKYLEKIQFGPNYFQHTWTCWHSWVLNKYSLDCKYRAFSDILLFVWWEKYSFSWETCVFWEFDKSFIFSVSEVDTNLQQESHLHWCWLMWTKCKNLRLGVAGMALTQEPPLLFENLCEIPEPYLQSHSLSVSVCGRCLYPPYQELLCVSYF